LKREDPTFVPPNSSHAGPLSDLNSKFASGVSLSEKRPRDDEGPAGRAAKREKQEESDDEMELDDDDDENTPAPKSEL
jgi:U2 small nuclear ribonucleoprotein B''